MKAQIRTASAEASRARQLKELQRDLDRFLATLEKTNLLGARLKAVARRAREEVRNQNLPCSS